MSTETTTTTAAAPDSAPAGAAPDTALTAAPATAPAAAPTAAAPAADAPVVDSAKADGTAPTDDANQAPVARAPAEYADFALPDGALMPDDVALMVKETAKELDLTQEQAQKIVDLNIKRDQAMHARVQTESTRWLNELPSDKEFGGEKFSENLAVARKAMEAFGTPELKDILERSRLGNHPEVIRVFFRAGKAISQDNRLVTGGSGDKPVKADAASSLYPNQKPA